MDQLVAETITTLHPDSLRSTHATDALRRLMHYYGDKYPADYWARLVSSTVWREQRPGLIVRVAEQDWLEETDALTALQCAELSVMAVEALASLWTPENCRVMVVRVDDTPRMSLVCALEGFR